MTSKKDFMAKLRHALNGIPQEETRDILLDYEEFFNGGLADGRSEEELATSLGDPKAIANQFRAEYMVKIAKDTPSISNMLNAIIATMGLAFFQVIGLSFIVVGLLLFLRQSTLINLTWQHIWPIFIIFFGLAFECSYFTNPRKGKTNASFLIPGGILTIVGLIFQYAVFTSFSNLSTLWPLFVLAVAVGLFQFYYFGGKNGWMLIPVFILGVASGIFLLKNLTSTVFFGYTIALLFIGTGLLVGLIIGKR